MAAREEDERERPPPGRWESDAAPRDTAATYSAGWGSPPGPEFGGPLAQPQGTAYGSGRWSGLPGQENPSGHSGTSATGYGQSVSGHSGYGQTAPGAGVSYASASGRGGYTGYAGGYAGARTPLSPSHRARPCGATLDEGLHPDGFDLDYQQWRNEQLHKLDNDYRLWREARYRRFADEFDAWRASRQDPAAVVPATSMTSTALRGTELGSAPPRDEPVPPPPFPTN
ncbi:MAG: hypothetical protein RL522_268 [Pseudomonadota bacterium]